LRNNRPKAAIAFKFPHEKKPSILREIVWQVGKSGRVTPVANVDTVHLAGANVSRASLHNLSNIAALVKGHRSVASLAVGDKVLVSRRNDVIPYIESVITPDPNGRVLAAPTVCPECSEDLSMQGEYLMCANSSACPAQVAGLLVRWVEKIGIKGWGSTIIEALVAAGTVSEPADLYNLDPNELAQVALDGRVIGSTAHTIIKELRDKGMELSLHVFIGSLGIPLCARSVAKMIVDAGYDDLAKMRNATLTEIASIPRLGSTKADSFVKGLGARADIIDNLLLAGVTIKPPADGPLKGLTVCMTGFRDPSMTQAIEDAGGTVKSGVGKTLSILVANDPTSTSGKAKKARGYGVEIIAPDDMWDRLGGRP
jgi:DNA ligase (NAD+)